MCDVASGLATLGVLQAGASHMAKVQGVDAYNAAAAQTQYNAVAAANQQYSQAQTRYAQEAKSASMDSYDAALEKNAAVALARASGGSSGVSGISFDALMADISGAGSRNIDKLAARREFALTDYLSSTSAIESEQRNRINAAGFRKGPNIGEFVLDAGFKAASGYAMGGGSLSDLLSISPDKAYGALGSQGSLMSGPYGYAIGGV